MGAGALDQLLADVKVALNKTWNDAQTDDRLRGILQRGMFYLDDKRGSPADYTVIGYPRLLLIEYARYADCEALDVFENNYMSLILAMRDERRVADYDTAQAAIQTVE